MNPAPPAPLSASPPVTPARRPLAWRVLGALGKGLAVLVLALATAFVGTYFWLASTPGRAQLTALVRDAAPALEVDLVAWGPAPGTVIVGPGRVRDASGRELATLNGGSVRVSPLSILDGPLQVTEVELELGRVAVSQGPDGRLDLATALAPPRPPAVASSGAPKPRAPVRVEVFRAHVAELAVDLQPAPNGLVVRDLAVTGALTLGAPDAQSLTFDLRTGAVDAAWNRGRKVIGFAHASARVALRGDAVTIEQLALTRDGGGAEVTVLSLHGTVTGLTSSPAAAGAAANSDTGGAATTKDKAAANPLPTVSLSITASLSPFDAHVLVGSALPCGLDLDGVDVVVGPDVERGVRVTGSVGQAMAGRWTSGPFAIDHLALAGARFVATPGLLVPELELDVDGVSAARMTGIEWRLEGLDLTPLGASLEKRLDAFAHARVGAWTLPTGDVGPAELALATTLKLTGGTLDALARTSFGDIDARGLLRSSPLTKKTDFSATFALRDLTGPLREAFLHDLDDATRLRLLGPDGAAPLSGTAELELELDREAPQPDAADPDRGNVWVTALSWVAGRLVGKTPLAWDGYAWSDAPEPPSEAPDAPEDP